MKWEATFHLPHGREETITFEATDEEEALRLLDNLIAAAPVEIRGGQYTLRALDPRSRTDTRGARMIGSKVYMKDPDKPDRSAVLCVYGEEDAEVAAAAREVARNLGMRITSKVLHELEPGVAAGVQ